MISVWVPGAAKTKGSVDTTRRGRVSQAVRGSEDWAFAIYRAVGDVMCRPENFGIGRGPVFVRLTFWLPVPDVTKAQTGDIDKLMRNVLDALTKAGAYGDDVQVTRSEQVKYACADGEPAGVLIEFESDAPWGMLGRGRATEARWHAMRAQGLA